MHDTYDTRMIIAKSERDDAIRAAGKLANALQDLNNEIGEVPHVQTAYRSVENLVRYYEGGDKTHPLCGVSFGSISIVLDNGRFLLRHKSGEAMAVEEPELEKLLLDFYKQNF